MEPIIVQWMAAPGEGPYVWIDTILPIEIEEMAVLVHVKTGGVYLASLGTVRVIDLRVLAAPFQKPDLKKKRRWWFLGSR
jgi:hypothetical protein